jgi:hypothetical protein
VVPPDSHRLPRDRWYSGTHQESVGFRLRDFHPLWSAFPGAFCYPPICNSSALNRMGPTTPPRQVRTVWAIPRSLAATEGISVDFFSSGYWDVSLPQVVSSGLSPDPKARPLSGSTSGCPIRKSPDQSLFAAPRGLSQLVTSFVGFRRQGIHHMHFVA